MRLFEFVPIFFLVAPSVFAQQVDHDIEQGHELALPHHLSVLLADTHVGGEGNNFTIGIDYEYRVSQLLGVGTVVERAKGELEATTVLAVADLHTKSGINFQVGPGYERRHQENVLVTRIGVMYEFEIERLTFSPQLHWDYHEHEQNAIVLGFALGFPF